MRYQVLASACTLAVITYLHRVGFATAWAEFKTPLGLSDDDLGRVMAAFMIGYGIFEMPWGFLGDRFGVRHTVAAIVLGGSALTALLVLVAFLPPQAVLIVGFLVVGPIPLRRLPGGDISVDRTDDGRLDAIERAGLGPGRDLDVEPDRRRAGAACSSSGSSRSWAVGSCRSFSWRLLGILWCALFWPWFRNQPGRHAVGQRGRAQADPRSGGRTTPATRHGRGPLAHDGAIEKRVVSVPDVRFPRIQRQLLLDLAADLSEAPPPSRLASDGLAHLAAVRVRSGRLPGRRFALRRDHPPLGKGLEPAPGRRGGPRPGRNWRSSPCPGPKTRSPSASS